MSFFSVLEYKREQSIKHQKRLQEAAKERRKDVVYKKKKYSKDQRDHHRMMNHLEMDYIKSI